MTGPEATTGEGGWRGALLRARHVLVEADHLSHVNKYLPWRYPLGSLAMAGAAAALCGWYVHVQAFTLLIGVAAVIALGLAWPALSIRAIRGRLEFERARGVEGRPVAARLTVTNYLPLGAWGLRLYGGSRGWAGAESVVCLAAIPGWRTTSFTFPFTPPARGEYPVGHAALGTGFPFGLWEARRPLQTAGSLVAWPAAFEVGGVPEAAASDRTREGLVYQNRAGHGGDFLGVRPYVRGDSLRRIHWPQTARHETLMICERQASANVTLQIVLDADPAAHGGRGPSGSREWAIRLAASLAETFLARGALVELVAGGVLIPIGGGEAQRRAILDALARLPDAGHPPLATLLAAPAARRFASGLQAVIATDRALDAAPTALLRRPQTHAIVFRASAFEPGGRAEPAGRRDAWIEVATASDVPGAIRRAWREVLHAN